MRSKQAPCNELGGRCGETERQQPQGEAFDCLQSARHTSAFLWFLQSHAASRARLQRVGPRPAARLNGYWKSTPPSPSTMALQGGGAVH